MRKAILTAAVIASLGSTALAQGIEPVTTVSGRNDRLTVGDLTPAQLAALATSMGITVAVLIASLNQSTDGTN